MSWFVLKTTTNRSLMMDVLPCLVEQGRRIMGVKVREKEKDSGIWWVFINNKGRRSSRQVGTKKAAEKVKEHIEARLKLGQDALPKEKPAVPTVEEYWE